MKKALKYLLIFTVLFTTTMLSSCSKDDEVEEPVKVIEKEDEVLEKEVILRDNERVDIMQDFDLTQTTYNTPTKSFELHSMIANDVIFQQEKNVRVFGKAEAGTVILVKLTKDDQQAQSSKASIVVPDNGEWIVELPPLTASFYTYTLTISDTVNEELVTGCLIGEVWLTSGQSNMELKVEEMDNGPFQFGNIDEEYVRIFTQRRDNNNISFPYNPAYDVNQGTWKKANSYDNIDDVSGVALSFAYETFYSFVEQGKQVPIAIINTAIGGTQIQAWLPREELASSPTLVSYANGGGYDVDDSNWNNEDWSNYNQVSALYNSRIAPLGNFNIRGVAWYQGESDPLYEQTIIATEKLIQSWSKLFNKSDELLYFALIQLAPYDGYDPLQGASTKNYTYVGFANHRRAQFDIVMKDEFNEKVFLIPIQDLDLKWDVPAEQFEWADIIHPIVKIPVGDRLSKIIMSFVYLKDNEQLAPIFDSYTATSDSIFVTFKNVGEGLTLYKDSEAGITTVEIVDNMGRRTTVDAVIVSNTQIMINNIDVSNVKQLTFSNFTRNEESNLGNSYGIPAIPFVVDID